MLYQRNWVRNPHSWVVRMTLKATSYLPITRTLSDRTSIRPAGWLLLGHAPLVVDPDMPRTRELVQVVTRRGTHELQTPIRHDSFKN